MIQYNVDVDDLREIENALGMSKDKSKQILKSAINSTEKETTKLLSGEANKRYYIKKTKVDKTLDTKKATVYSHHRSKNPLSEYNAVRNTVYVWSSEFR